MKYDDIHVEKGDLYDTSFLREYQFMDEDMDTVCNRLDIFEPEQEEDDESELPEEDEPEYPEHLHEYIKDGESDKCQS